jgi:hypothetical protein
VATLRDLVEISKQNKTVPPKESCQSKSISIFNLFPPALLTSSSLHLLPYSLYTSLIFPLACPAHVSCEIFSASKIAIRYMKLLLPQLTRLTMIYNGIIWQPSTLTGWSFPHGKLDDKCANTSSALAYRRMYFRQKAVEVPSLAD